MSPYTISPSTLTDIPDLLRVINSAYRGEASRAGWTTEADYLDGELRTDAGHLAELIGREQAVILKCCDAGSQLAGCVFLENHAGRLYLGMLSVQPNRQAQGIGKLLLQGAEAHARQAGCRSIYMRVITLRTELIDWYVRHGYARTGEVIPFESPAKFGVPRQPLAFEILEKVIQV